MAWGDTLPRNFSWLAVNQLAGSACPSSELELMSLRAVGICHVISLSPEHQPPSCLQTMPRLASTRIDIQNFKGADIADFERFYRVIESVGKASDAVGCGVLVHCSSGLGRTGMFLAAYLIKYQRMSADDAILRVRELRPRSVETRDQEIKLRLLESYLAGQEVE